MTASALGRSPRPLREVGGLPALLYGSAPVERLVAVEAGGEHAVSVYCRDADGRVSVEHDILQPWLLVAEEGVECLQATATATSTLDGAGALRRLVRFTSWRDFTAARAALREAGAAFFAFGSPVAQYLLLAGRTLFYGMRFEDVLRVQLDIETTTLRAGEPGAAILLAAVTASNGHEEVLSAAPDGEAALLRRLTERICELDPDVIEGHNVVDFDLPYLAARAERLDVPLTWGRAGQPVRLRESRGRLKVGARLLPSVSVHIYGRHVVDTYQQVQRFDSDGKLERYGLKPVMELLGLVRPAREFVEQDAIKALWRSDPERLARYCLDDARDVRTLAEIVTPTDFYQTQLVPRSYQDVLTGGTGEKINAMMVRAYVAANMAVPLPQEPRPYPGGYVELRRAGVFRRVVKCDVESLYPAVMLRYGYRPASDTLGVFLPLLGELTARRLDAKARAHTAPGADRAYWDGVSGSYKVLINSFYGYLGYARANFNDYDAAEQVTTTGQRLIKDVLVALEAQRCEIIEVDTDGVYFVPPDNVSSEDAERVLVEEVGQVLPDGIRLAYDGRFAGMVALKPKTYFLLTYEGRLVARGSSLRSRRDESYLRSFVQEAAIELIEGSLEDVSRRYADLARRVQAGDLPVQAFSRRESVTGKTFVSPGLKRLATAAKGVAVGQKIDVYQRRDGALASVAAYAGDEDRDYLLRRLHDMARRFEPLCADPSEFKRLFPRFTESDDIGAPRPRQLSLFD